MVGGDIIVLSSRVSSDKSLASIICKASGIGTLVNKLFTSKLTIKSESHIEMESSVWTKCEEFLM